LWGVGREEGVTEKGGKRSGGKRSGESGRRGERL